MATFSGDVQYSQNGTVTNPCNQYRQKLPHHSWSIRLRYLRQRPGTLHQLHSRRKDIQRTAAKEVQHMPREGHPGGGASHKNGEWLW